MMAAVITRPSPMSPDDLLRPSECAALYQVHPETVRRWLRKGIVPCVEVGPFHARRIRRSDADRFFRSVDGVAS
jgi:excisionase family DNA binding protein